MPSSLAPNKLGCPNLDFPALFQAVEEEDKMTPEQLAIKNVGKQVQYIPIADRGVSFSRVFWFPVIAAVCVD